MGNLLLSCLATGLVLAGIGNYSSAQTTKKGSIYTPSYYNSNIPEIPISQGPSGRTKIILLDEVRVYADRKKCDTALIEYGKIMDEYDKCLSEFNNDSSDYFSSPKFTSYKRAADRLEEIEAAKKNHLEAVNDYYSCVNNYYKKKTGKGFFDDYPGAKSDLDEAPFILSSRRILPDYMQDENAWLRLGCNEREAETIVKEMKNLEKNVWRKAREYEKSGPIKDNYYELAPAYSYTVEFFDVDSRRYVNRIYEKDLEPGSSFLAFIERLYSGSFTKTHGEKYTRENINRIISDLKEDFRTYKIFFGVMPDYLELADEHLACTEGGSVYRPVFKEPVKPDVFAEKSRLEEMLRNIKKPVFDPYYGMHFHPRELAASSLDNDSVMGVFTDSPWGNFEIYRPYVYGGRVSQSKMQVLMKEDFCKLEGEIQEMHVPNAEGFREALCGCN